MTVFSQKPSLMIKKAFAIKFDILAFYEKTHHNIYTRT